MKTVEESVSQISDELNELNLNLIRLHYKLQYLIPKSDPHESLRPIDLDSDDNLVDDLGNLGTSIELMNEFLADLNNNLPFADNEVAKKSVEEWEKRADTESEPLPDFSDTNVDY